MFCGTRGRAIKAGGWKVLLLRQDPLHPPKQAIRPDYCVSPGDLSPASFSALTPASTSARFIVAVKVCGERGAGGAAARIPRARGAKPKRTWRQPQADVAPNPNPCQLFPIAAHCRFEPFQALGRSRKRHSPLAAACPSQMKRAAQDRAFLFRARQLCRASFDSRKWQPQTLSADFTGRSLACDRRIQ
jgi:hypothetical protein